MTNSLNADKTTSHAYGVQTYNSVDNIFTAPNDGYLTMNTWGSEKLITHMCNSAGETIILFSCPAGESKNIFIRKGQKMWFEYASLNSVQFIFARLT